MLVDLWQHSYVEDFIDKKNKNAEKITVFEYGAVQVHYGLKELRRLSVEHDKFF